MGSYYKKQLNDWKASLDVNAERVLDIGGAQDPLKGKTKTWDVLDYKIMDLSEPHVKSVEPDIIHDMNDEYRGNHKFNAIFCLGVFDYVIEPGVAMRNIAKLMDNDGYAWVEFPLFYGHHEPLEDEGCRYSEGCIKRLVNRAGLKIDDILRKPAGNDYLVRFMREDGQRLSKRYAYHNTTGFIVKVSHGA